MSKNIYGQAVQDFQRAKQRAGLQTLLARWQGRSLDLLSYDEVKKQLKAYGEREMGLRQIPLDAIVGSVGRYRDFNRNFLPRVEGDKSRWAAVKTAQVEQGLPPIEVYQIGEAYFVLDGNHRVSVAREMGNETIEAYVTEVKTRVPLEPDDEPSDIILKAEYADFLACTRLDELKPNANLSLTSPGKYPLLMEHIEVHRFYLGVEQNREIPYEEAVIHWYEHVYRPTVRLIRDSGLIRDFPQRTEADMYVWLADHRAEIEHMLGWEVPTEMAVEDMAANFGNYKPDSLKSRALQAVLPGAQDATSSVGRWRLERLRAHEGQHFLKTLLIPFTGYETDWRALDQAIVAAQREESHIYGLQAAGDKRQRQTILTRALQAEFERRCSDAGVSATFIVEVDDLDKLVSKRGRWADAIVLRQVTSSEGDSKADSLFRQIVQSASGPILIAPEQSSPLDRALLAYDDRPESDEALYIAAYFGDQWGIPVTVLHVDSGDEDNNEVAEKAIAYLTETGVEANLVVRDGDVVEAILSTAEEQQSDLILMGSSKLSPMLKLVLGSTVNQLLGRVTVPLLLCR